MIQEDALRTGSGEGQRSGEAWERTYGTLNAASATRLTAISHILRINRVEESLSPPDYRIVLASTPEAAAHL